jgi:hypothetical protein
LTDDELDPSNIFKGNNLFHISAFDHLVTRGYVKNVPGAMCGFRPNRCPSSRELTVPKWNCAGNDYCIPATDRDGDSFGRVKVEFNACKGKDGNDNDLVPTSSVFVTRRESPPRPSYPPVGRRNCPAVIQTFIDDLIAAQEEADEEEDLP